MNKDLTPAVKDLFKKAVEKYRTLKKTEVPDALCRWEKQFVSVCVDDVLDSKGIYIGCYLLRYRHRGISDIFIYCCAYTPVSVLFMPPARWPNATSFCGFHRPKMEDIVKYLENANIKGFVAGFNNMTARILESDGYQMYKDMIGQL